MSYFWQNNVDLLKKIVNKYSYKISVNTTIYIALLQLNYNNFKSFDIID